MTKTMIPLKSYENYFLKRLKRNYSNIYTLSICTLAYLSSHTHTLFFFAFISLIILFLFAMCDKKNKRQMRRASNI